MPLAPRRRTAGFSLVELMVSVTIIAILAALAIPSYVRYIVRSKSVEAAMGVRKLFDAAAAYYSTERADAAGVPVRRQFPPTQTWTPVLNACCNPPQIAGRCAANPALWKTPIWEALNFSVDDPHYYQFSAERVPNVILQNPGDQYWLQASGNLDCDLVFSRYVRTATITPQFDVRGGSGLYIDNATE